MNKDESKTKAALIEELDELRKKVSRLDRQASKGTAAPKSSGRFHDLLLALLSLLDELGLANSFDELCRRAVELGRSHLGFDRVGIWFRSNEDPHRMVGCFGTDENGQTRDERDCEYRLTPKSPQYTWFDEMAKHTDPMRPRATLFQDVPLRNCLIEVIGQGDQILSPIWDGRNVIGLITADNFIHKHPMSKAEEELLALYGTTLGYFLARWRAERAHQRSEERYQGIFDNSALGIYQSTPEGRFLKINAAGARMMGYESPQAMLSEIENIADSIYVDPENRHRIIEVIVNQPGMRRFENEYKRKDGSTFTGSLHICAVRDEAGAVQYLEGFLEDISERKRAEEALRENEEKYRTLFEVFPDATFLETLDGRIVDCNSATCTIYGYSREELLECTVTDLVPNETALSLPDVTSKILSDGGVNIEAWAKRKNGELFPTQVRTRLTTLGGRPMVLVHVNDITSRKRAEEEREKIEAQMRMAQKLESLGILAGGVAHDFNNLLMGVLGNASLALMELPEASPVRESVEQIEEAAKRAADLAKQMLAYSGKGKFEVKSIDLSVLVEEIMHLLKASISKNITLKYEFAPNLPAIEGDVTQLRQVIMNLVINAAEAIGENNGIVTIRTGTMWCEQSYLADSVLNEDRPPGHYVCLEVSDTGCGMDETTRTKIFDPFFTSKFAGRGLGLAVVLGIVRGHKGAVRVYSEPRHGTTFKTLFPRSSCPADAISETQAGDLVFQGEGTILLVDDEKTVRQTAKGMLEKIGFSVLTAENGRKGVEIFKAHTDEIRAVLLDMTMPHMNGQDVLKKIHRIRKDTPVILSSGYNEQDATARFAKQDRAKGEPAALAGFIQKPYQLHTLTEKLSLILR